MIIAGAGGAAHLPGVCAAWTALPVLGVPIESQALKGMDSLLSMVQMPAGVPVGTLAIGRAGAVNAALLAAAILAIADRRHRRRGWTRSARSSQRSRPGARADRPPHKLDRRYRSPASAATAPTNVPRSCQRAGADLAQQQPRRPRPRSRPRS